MSNPTPVWRFATLYSSHQVFPRKPQPDQRIPVVASSAPLWQLHQAQGIVASTDLPLPDKKKYQSDQMQRVYTNMQLERLVMSSRAIFKFHYFPAYQLLLVIFVWPRLLMKMARELKARELKARATGLEFPRYFHKQSRPNENNLRQLVSWKRIEREFLEKPLRLLSEPIRNKILVSLDRYTFAFFHFIPSPFSILLWSFPIQ